MCNKFGDNLRNHLLTRRPPVANERVAEMQILGEEKLCAQIYRQLFQTLLTTASGFADRTAHVDPAKLWKLTINEFFPSAQSRS